jgi:uncharacterized membrane protein
VDPLRHHRHESSAFGSDAFGRAAERLARFFGTPRYIITQTVIVVLWIVGNGFELLIHFDKFPFILLNLAFSTQAAYAAPLILLAQTRQADRDKATTLADAQHREEIAAQQIKLLQANTDLTEQVAQLTREVHARVIAS